jgi:hypothetical protein
LINPGNLLFGENKKVSLSENANLARDGQGQMLYGASLKNIVVFYEQRSQNDCKKFVDMLRQVLQYFKMEFDEIS